MNDIEKKLEALKVEFLGKLEALEKEAEMRKEQREPKPWNPEIGKEYFYIGSILEIGKYFNWDDSIDNRLITVGNCFPTKKRAEQVAEKVRLLLRLEQLHDMLCPDYVPDWGKCGQKFLVYFNHVENQWTIGVYNAFEMRCETYFDTNENAKKAAEILNKEIENYE